jgi:hypothetical protein
MAGTQPHQCEIGLVAADAGRISMIGPVGWNRCIRFHWITCFPFSAKTWFRIERS